MTNELRSDSIFIGLKTHLIDPIKIHLYFQGCIYDVIAYHSAKGVNS